MSACWSSSTGACASSGYSEIPMLAWTWKTAPETLNGSASRATTSSAAARAAASPPSARAGRRVRDSSPPRRARQPPPPRGRRGGGRLAAVGEVGQQDQELVAAEPRQHATASARGLVTASL